MNNIPTGATKVAQAEAALIQATQQANNPTLSAGQRKRAKQIAQDLAKHAGKLATVIMIVAFMGGPAIAAERWTPSPDRGSANGTLPGGYR